jgi:uncharacterized protein YcbK (DUF882 family)
MGDISEHFNLREFFSANDHGQTFKARAPRPELLDTLEAIRSAVKAPVHIESGIRSVEHNRSLPGSASDSAHLTGEAADVWVDGLSNADLGKVIRSLHAGGLLPYLRYTYLIEGTSATRVHVGVDTKPRKSIWGPGY